MASITIRNIPESILSRIRALSRIEMRSINSEMLLLLEKGLNQQFEQRENETVLLARERQIEMWEHLAGSWDDSRSAAEINEDIYSHRTRGREVDL